MKIKNLIILSITAITLMLTACQSETKTTYEYATISRDTIKNTVSAVGTFEATENVVIQAPVSGIVDAIFVLPGDKIEKGQKLADMNTTGDPTNRDIVPVYSPIDGIVADTSVSVGTSILGRGSPAATTLFTLTSDTDELIISAPIGELDIGNINIGTEVLASIKAMPGRMYSSKVSTIIPLATTIDNVTTYTVKCLLSNNDGTLRPGMTATLQFIVEKEDNVLVVPNAALRFTLSSDEGNEKTNTSSANAVTNALTGGKANSSSGNPFGHPVGPQSYFSENNTEETKTNNNESVKTEKTLYYEDDNGNLKSIKVYAGISDGINTAVEPIDENVNIENMKVILREIIE